MEEKSYRIRRKRKYYTGEDIEMLREREQSRKDNHRKNICDTNIDGA